jgi:hypothetical protein
MNTLNKDKQAQVIAALVAGNSIRATVQGLSVHSENRPEV